ncbi:MAG TPA: hypothetical protein VGP26_21110 [Actinophytocola sp.]|nr:hypothetical protein [Actinophytocola sp.]
MRRTASDLLVALALVHGADHLAGGQVVQDQRAPGGVVAVVSGGLPSRRPGPNRQLRRTRFDANTRRIPPRTPAAAIRAAIRSSAIAAAFTSPWFTPRDRLRGAASRRRGTS